MGRSVITPEYIGSGVSFADVVRYVNEKIENGDGTPESQSEASSSQAASSQYFSSINSKTNVQISSVSLSLPSCCSLPQFWDCLVSSERFYHTYSLLPIDETNTLIDGIVCEKQPHIERAFLKLGDSLEMPFGFLDKELKNATDNSLASLCIASIEDVSGVLFTIFSFILVHIHLSISFANSPFLSLSGPPQMWSHQQRPPLFHLHLLHLSL